MKRLVLFTLIFTLSFSAIIAEEKSDRLLEAESPALAAAESSSTDKFYLPKLEKKSAQENPYAVIPESLDTYNLEGLYNDESDAESLGALLQLILLPVLMYSDYKNPEQEALRESNAPLDRMRREYDKLSH